MAELSKSISLQRRKLILLKDSEKIKILVLVAIQQRDRFWSTQTQSEIGCKDKSTKMAELNESISLQRRKLNLLKDPEKIKFLTSKPQY